MKAKEGTSQFFQDADRLDGIMFWALYQLDVVPKIRIFKYIGYNPLIGMHYFQSVRGAQATVAFNNYQVAQGIIKPFCLNTSYLGEE